MINMFIFEKIMKVILFLYENFFKMSCKETENLWALSSDFVKQGKNIFLKYVAHCIIKLLTGVHKKLLFLFCF